MKQLREGIDFYYNEDGYVVLTATYHLAKGFCCGNGCRHCPYDYENVPEPRRSQLNDEKESTPPQNSTEEGGDNKAQA